MNTKHYGATDVVFQVSEAGF